MNNNIYYLTEEGKENLVSELQDLKENGRKEIAQRLKSAIAMGDLSENADYIAAKEDQGFLEGRIQEIENILQNVKVIINQTTYQSVSLGAQVTIQEADYPPETYQLVGIHEANPSDGRISHESPIGKALLNHKVGDIVTVHLPNGEITEFEIKEIK